MDLMSKDASQAFGLGVVESIEHLVNSHDDYLDKRAAMFSVDQPSLSQGNDSLVFEFKIVGNRQSPVVTSIEISAMPEDPSEESFEPSLDISMQAVPRCGCIQFSRDQRCPHSLAAAWWLQEQLGRRGATDVLEFFSSLKIDAYAAGRDLVDQLIDLTTAAKQETPAVEVTRLQWRIGLSHSRYHCPISITAYEQRPRKNGKGWTKGREVRSYDLLRRDFSSHPIDSRIAALVATPSYSFDDDHYCEFEALRMLVGHPNVAWDDANGAPVTVYTSEITLGLVPVEARSSGHDAEDSLDDESEPVECDDVQRDGDANSEAKGRRSTRFRPVMGVSGLRINPHECQVLLGHASPVEPLVVIADQKHDRVVICELRDARATPLIQHLFRSDLGDVLLDSDTASRLVLASAAVNTLVHVELPDQLAGPILEVTAELIFELRPRAGAGLQVSLSMHDPRFNQTITPSQNPEVLTCLNPEGPVRLKRDLAGERKLAEQVVEQFELPRLKQGGAYHYIAETDEQALDLLGRLYAAGESAPRMTWPEGETIRVRSEITPSALRVRVDDRKDWFGLSGSIDLDGHEVLLADLLAAVRERRALVQVGDREFAKISDAFRKRLEQLGDAVIVDRGALRIADAAVPAVQELLGEDVTLDAAARWHDSIARLESLANWTPDKPELLHADLRDYQLDGFRWLARLSRWGVGGVLADDMGLGKTVQAIAVLLQRGNEGPTLVVAPTSVGDNWVRETERFAPSLRPLLYRDSDREQLVENAGANDLVIVSYQLLQRDAERFASRHWHTLVLDEAQFIKNAQTKTSQAIRRLEADWRIGLSGTPLENYLGELWSLFRTLSPGLLGSWERFRTRFADPIERHKDEDRRESLAQLVRPFILRRTKNNVLKELPPRTEVNLQAVLSPAERKLYEDTRISAVAELSGTGIQDLQNGDQRIRTLAWLTRLRQLACHPSLVDSTWRKSSAKLDLFLELVTELRDGSHRALVFSQFVKHLTVIRRSLDEQGISYQYLDGATPAKERQRRVDAFQNGEGDLFLISLKAGGTGLNLTAADYVIHLDPWWNPAVEDQATDRAHRIGQERPVTVYRLVAQGTIEEQILQLHADKRELVGSVLDGTDTAAKLDTKDLIEMIKQGAMS